MVEEEAALLLLLLLLELLPAAAAPEPKVTPASLGWALSKGMGCPEEEIFRLKPGLLRAGEAPVRPRLMRPGT
jgi:hypothetical protein